MKQNIFYYLWQNTSQLAVRMNVSPEISEASGGDNLATVSSDFRTPYCVKNTAQAKLTRVGYFHPKGFTLIELLVVISIISLLSSIVLTTVNSARMKSRDARRIADLHQITLALELYFDTNGYYPPSACGWDCNGYSLSYEVSNWAALATALAPYIPTLPTDPINNGCVPWNVRCFAYSYGNVGRSTQRVQYDLTAALEDPNNPNRCAVKGYRFYFDNQPWCGPYTVSIYEASLN